MIGPAPILILATILLAGAALGVTAAMPAKERASFVYAQLVLMAGIYVGFAIIGLEPVETANKAKWSALLIEGVAAIVFMLAGHSVLSSNRAWLLGALILVHGAVDLAHLLTSRTYSPDWYEFSCAIYDAIVGVGAIWLLTPNSETR
ncbi:hypothetical protein [Hyphococcus sp.]|uniref:hypothetical protein n=1 Tax=Hyphococcus sp. TaxID=2038636 RepID=UPI00207E1B47|nr:MAG: hypothetical protein DHS20C04_04520 [Marinicaulis sp.]